MSTAEARGGPLTAVSPLDSGTPAGDSAHRHPGPSTPTAGAPSAATRRNGANGVKIGAAETGTRSPDRAGEPALKGAGAREGEPGRRGAEQGPELAQRAGAVRNQLVDTCEKLQLKALRIERFVNNVLPPHELDLQGGASRARDAVLRRLAAVREACDEEEQRLLEAVQREEERVQHSLLTQRAHWAQALGSLSAVRAQLVRLLTETEDRQLLDCSQEISDRVEVAEGVGEPQDSEHLTFNPRSSQSPLLLNLWANAVLLCRSGQCDPEPLSFDERTVSPLLSLSDDGRTLTFLPRRARQPQQYSPLRFDRWPNALCGRSFSSGTHRWLLEVGRSAAFKVGVSYGSLERKGPGNGARLGYNAHSWVLSHFDGEFCFLHAGRAEPLPLLRRPRRLCVLLDWGGGALVFLEPDSGAVLHAHHQVFTAALHPACAVANESISLLDS
uniref:B-box and SPRY domain containing n=1 Tax=Lepisosteus oculatus TaxID=7918 RepID=W5LY44_LEPOC|nr:PREDICTED: B box and SPRY domain-containing protein isoform X1 [Lepisosteus oculatus]